MSREDEAVRSVGDDELVFRSFQSSPARSWVLLEGSRPLVVVVVSALVFVAVALLAVVGVVPAADSDAVPSLLGAVVGGTLPFITIVLAINQLVLSQELGWADELRERFRGVREFRREVEELTGEDVSPAAPADFLELVVRATVERAESLEESTAEIGSEEYRDELGRYVSDIRAEGEEVAAALDDADFGTFQALSAVLNHYDGRHLHQAELLRSAYADDAAAAEETYDELVELLEHLAVARQTFKTLYMQHELAKLSKYLLYVGFPAMVGGGLLYVSYGSLLEPTGEVGAVVLAAAGVTLVFLPFAVLFAYTLRIATVAGRTVDFGPFVPRARLQHDRDD